MICSKCKNKRICKYYDYIITIPIDITIDISSCENFEGVGISQNNVQPLFQNQQVETPMPRIRKPLDIPVEKEEIPEDAERIIVDINNLPAEEDVSLFDSLLSDLTIGKDEEDGE